MPDVTRSAALAGEPLPGVAAAVIERIFAILNPGSGAGDASAIEEVLRQRAAGRQLEVVRPQKGDDLGALVRDLVKRADQASDVVVAAGGDGTVNAVADALRGSPAAFCVVPLGTFNYFARDLGVPADVDGALALLDDGEPRKVSVGTVNDVAFLNNASLGMYTTLIRERESAKRHWGRKRIVDTLVMVRVLLRGRSPFRLQMTIDGSPGTVTTPMVFVGNNTLQLEQLGLDVANVTRPAPSGADGSGRPEQLALVVLRPVSRWQMFKLVLRAAIGHLAGAGELDTIGVDDLTLTSSHSPVDVVVDGEIKRLKMPLRFRIHRGVLRVLVPKTPAMTTE